MLQRHNPDDPAIDNLLNLSESYIHTARYALTGLESTELELTYTHPIYLLIAQAFELLFNAGKQLQENQQDLKSDLPALWRDPQLKILHRQAEYMMKGWQRESFQDAAFDFEKQLNLLSHLIAPHMLLSGNVLREAVTLPNINFLIFSAENFLQALRYLNEADEEE